MGWLGVAANHGASFELAGSLTRRE